MTIMIFIHEQNFRYLSTGYGLWFLVEVLGFVLVPMILFFFSYRKKKITLIKVASLFTLIGILLNRMNVSIIAFRWNAAERYIPSWKEFVVTLTIIFIEIWIFRAIVRRMPVLRKSPDWVQETH